MSVAKVLKLAEYRDRRHHRLKLAQAFFQVDSGRRDIARHLAEIASVSGADRVSAVWVDEYGPGLAHPHVVIDLLSDRPRAGYSIEPLRRAWEIGVPGAHDDVAVRNETGGSTFAVALGSDGARAWFVVADSVTNRGGLEAAVRERVMFLAGECSAVALHRDLDHDPQSAPASGETRFAGWQILEDLESREQDTAEARRIALRFVVARLARMLLDADGVMPPDRVAELSRAARIELARAGAAEEDERDLWLASVTAFERQDVRSLSSALLAVATVAERGGCEHGATELYECAFGLAASARDAVVGAEAARALGRVLRRAARRERSLEWYRAAHAIASTAEITHLAARALAGMATLRRERGNVPAAREILAEALRVAGESGDVETIVSLHRDMVSLEQSAGNMEAALRHAWLAVGATDTGRERARCLASLASVLGNVGNHELASDAWRVVAATADELYLRVFALDALGHGRALSGDRSGFERWAAECDALGPDTLPSAYVQVLHHRGLSYRALGDVERAGEWLELAVAYAEEHGFSETLIKAEADLQGLSAFVPEPTGTTAAAPPEVREGLRAMRRELAGAV